MLSPVLLPLISFNSLRPFLVLFFPLLPSLPVHACHLQTRSAAVRQASPRADVLRRVYLPARGGAGGVSLFFSSLQHLHVSLQGSGRGNPLAPAVEREMHQIRARRCSSRSCGAGGGARAGSLLPSPGRCCLEACGVSCPAWHPARGTVPFPFGKDNEGSSLPPAAALAAAACSLAVFPALRRVQEPCCGPAPLEGWLWEAGTRRRGQGFPKPLSALQQEVDGQDEESSPTPVPCPLAQWQRAGSQQPAQRRPLALFRADPLAAERPDRCRNLLPDRC